jgi:hypothetical protein
VPVHGEPITTLIFGRWLMDQGLRFNGPRTGTRDLTVTAAARPLTTAAPWELRWARQRGLRRMARWGP